MKKIVLKPVIILSLLLSTSSCLDYENLRENPNDPASVPPDLLFTKVLPEPASAFSKTYRYSQYHNYIAADAGVSPPVNYRFGSASFHYDKLRNISKMEEESKRTTAIPYTILAKFLKVYYYIEMTRRMGAIPLSEAMKAAENPTPKYDAQKFVYIQCLDWLDEANNALGNFIAENPNVTIDGDFYYNGNLKQWQKAINTYTIRVLLTLSKKADDADIDIKGRITKIVNNPTTYPLMTGTSDNMYITHKDEEGFRATYNPSNQILVEGIVYADTYIDLLKQFKDPRLFRVADPKPKALKENPDNEAVVRADFNAYEGSNIAVTLEINNAKKSAGEFSPPNKKRYLNYTGQASILLGYAEQELNLAEAAHRGWINANPKTYYDNGVSASMAFYDVSSKEISDYLSKITPYITGKAGLQRIHQQMYLALAENSNWEAWFLNRRTGVPTYKFSSVNKVEKLPVRWTYPTYEDSDNKVNYRAALKSQFGTETDNINQIIWLLKD